MKRPALVLMIFAFWLLVSGYYTNIYAQDETVTFLTYYPAPYGVYQTTDIGQTGHFLRIDYDATNIRHRIFSSSATDDIVFSHNGTANDLVVDTTGRIGVGTNNPGVNLHILGTGNAILYLQTPGAGTGQIIKYNTGRLTIGTGGAYNMGLLTSVGGSFQFDEGINTRMSIAPGGNVTINPGNLAVTGTATTGALTVNGTANITSNLTVGGNTTTVNNVPYTWPATQGAAGSVLNNNGSGGLTWASAAGGVTRIIAGTNITISPVTGTGDVTINSTGGGGGGGGITGSGTAGTIPKFSTNNSLEDSNIKEDSFGHIFVNIAEASPYSRFRVVENTTSAITGRRESTTRGYAGVTGTNNNGDGVSGTSSLGQWHSQDYYFYGRGFGVYGHNTENRGGGVGGMGHIGVWGESSGNAGRIGVLGRGYYGVMGRGMSSGGYDFYADGLGANYGPFTGAHDVKLHSSIRDIQPGMIVCTNGEIAIRENSYSDTMPTVVLSSKPEDNGVLGVFISERELTEDFWYKPREGERFGIVNAVGEGLVWVTNINGPLQNGDYITTSLIPGYGQRQDDNILHSYTLGKMLQGVDWEKVNDTIEYNGKKYKRCLVAVTYHSG